MSDFCSPARQLNDFELLAMWLIRIYDVDANTE